MQVPVEIKLKTVQTQAGEIEKFELLELYIYGIPRLKLAPKRS